VPAGRLARPSAAKGPPRRSVLARTARVPAKRASLEVVPAPPGLNEEDTIRSAKYLPRDLPPRLFEEERFLFPKSYGINRVRLLVKDPEWLFAHWDVNPGTLETLGASLGQRTMALARLTLRVIDPARGGSSDILLPEGARGWYIRADTARRSYRAELGLTLPSGEFRRIAESNVVVAPRVGPSEEMASRTITYGQAGRITRAAALRQAAEEVRAVGKSARGPWHAPSVDGAAEGSGAAGSGPPGSHRGGRPGASDTFRPGGASDVHRR
jgi:hypothetical protein